MKKSEWFVKKNYVYKGKKKQRQGRKCRRHMLSSISILCLRQKSWSINWNRRANTFLLYFKKKKKTLSPNRSVVTASSKKKKFCLWNILLERCSRINEWTTETAKTKKQKSAEILITRDLNGQSEKLNCQEA